MTADQQKAGPSARAVGTRAVVQGALREALESRGCEIRATADDWFIGEGRCVRIAFDKFYSGLEAELLRDHPEVWVVSTRCGFLIPYSRGSKRAWRLRPLDSDEILESETLGITLPLCEVFEA